MSEATDIGEYCALWRHLETPVEDLLATGQGIWCPRDELFRGRGSEFGRVLMALEKHYPELLRRDRMTATMWQRAQFEALMHAVRRAAPPGTSFRVRWRVAEVLDAGNRLGVWKVPLYDIPAPLPPPGKPVFRPETFERMVRYEPMFAHFFESIDLKNDALDDDRLAWGQILGALVLFGGLLQPRWLWAMPDSLESAPNHLRWIDLECAVDGNEKPALRRHFLDPVTRSVLLRWKLRWRPAPLGRQRRTPNALYKLIKTYLDHVAPDSDLPANWSELRDVVETRLALYIPPHLLAYASGRYASVSLPPEVIQRIEQPPMEIPLDDELPWENPIGASPIHNAGTAGDEEDEGEEGGELKSVVPVDAWIRDLGRVIRSGTKADSQSVRAWRESRAKGGEHSDEVPPPSVLRLAEWVEQWLFAKRPAARPMKPKSAYDYFNALATSLVRFLGNEDPAAFECVDDFVEVYSSLLEGAENPSKRKRLAAALTSFHAFLCSAYSAPNIHATGLFSVRGRQPHAVDANFVDPQAFDWAMRWLDWRYADDPDVREVLVLVACLGYFAGMRRSEAVGLMVSDIDGEPVWDCLVRPNRNRGLKSSSAHRVAPLGVLMPERYLSRLQSWWQMRWKQVANEGGDPSSARLFERSRRIVPEEQKLREFDADLERITDALIRVTGDRGLRYHHLRHSFANRMLLALWRYEHPEDELAGEWLDPLIGFEDLKQLREALLGKSPVQRRSLRLLSALMGHLTTEITMNHYVHMTDLLLGQAIRAVVPAIGYTQLARCLGVTRKYVEKRARVLGTGDTFLLWERMLDLRIGVVEASEAREETARQLVPPVDPHAALMLLGRYLNEQGSGTSTSNEFVPPWSAAGLQAIRDELKHWREHFRHSPTGRNDLLIDLPRTQQDQRLSRSVVDILFGDAAWKPSPRSRLLRIFEEGKRQSGPLDIRLETLPSLKLWVNFLEEVGRLEAYEFVHYSVVGGGRVTPMAQYGYWAQRSFVPLESGDSRNDGPAPGDASNRHGIVIARRKEATQTSQFRWVYGACWALTMAAILDRVEGQTPGFSLVRANP